MCTQRGMPEHTHMIAICMGRELEVGIADGDGDSEMMDENATTVHARLYTRMGEVVPSKLHRISGANSARIRCQLDEGPMI